MPSRPFPPSPIPTPKQPLPHYSRTRQLLLLPLTISFSSLLLISLLLLLFLYLYFSLRRRSPAAATAVNPTPSVPLRRFSYRELRSATNAFHPDHSLGRGGSGSVFRGVLRDGKLVAVKRLDQPSFDREFQNELRVLGGMPSSSPFVVSLLGYCVEKKRRLLVYEYLCNRSLQEALFGSEAARVVPSPELDWDRRYKVVLDVAQAIAFLHMDCNPPVIHGDIKPSNVLLGSDFRAKLSDFGLSRVKDEEDGGEFVTDLFSQEIGRSQELAAGESPPVAAVDFSLALRASSSSSKKALGGGGSGGGVSPKGKGMVGRVGSCEDELFSIDHSKESNGNGGGTSPAIDDSPPPDSNQLGNDWWWRQDGSGELCSRDYVSEWIGSQIRPIRNPDWDDDCDGGRSGGDRKSSPGKLEDKEETTIAGELCNDKKKEENIVGGGCDKKHKKMREWWKEEYFAEISKKSKCSKGFKCLRTSNVSSPQPATAEETVVGVAELGVDISFRKGWKKSNNSKKKRTCSIGGSDKWSGEFFSRELSSTTSMRGTVCYVAPETGGCNGGTQLMEEKADVYSFGVLVLVVVSGRRPLHVLSTPLRLERANLISWCRQLAQAGNVLELVDERLKENYNKEQASLCINLALLCLQRLPELRLDSGEIVRILKGEMNLPPLPIEFSPSPPLPTSKHGRSRRKSKPEMGVMV